MTAPSPSRRTDVGIRDMARGFAAFGGWKRSGFGDLNQHGPDAIRFYMKTETVTSRWPSGVKEGAEFVIPPMQ
jgi:malonate-semialdehyde dehydrogenase (acetylating)/methylmalonate-semialdehyde dehydrogenase